ncbi:predicted protein [Postia placenta Mad-698-R]|uniref:Methyltransferase domain-containing protein n=1 Tax=Postia placenta MAD-698-R-SB12 TaxID=670580 RepID=A0A1X6MK88_9APHY|nr:hypothetical protein POSPLADRAFT_1050678 [Postia placenta MAD-698-R-SB12]EED78309.1 predicted protein [Postia placenta Mad-698-R]OSX56463.1 hypothetical protein POSPLADRAFT_1050678 [Postia placenta MAD-698-R-SB12]
MSTSDSLHSVHAFLCTPIVNELLTTHPNWLCQNTESHTLSSEISSWWEWAGERPHGYSTANGPQVLPPVGEHKWLLLLRYYTHPYCDDLSDLYSSIPADLRELLDTARRLQLSREPGPARFLASSCPRNATREAVYQSVDYETFGIEAANYDRIVGMSPKKAHEVLRMTAYTSWLLGSSPRLRTIRHVVDVGAGQAYLSRSLRDKIGLNVLALDWSDVQSQGAVRREAVGKKRRKKEIPTPAEDESSIPQANDSNTPPVKQQLGALTYMTLRITTDTLLSSVDEWFHRGDEITTPEKHENLYADGEPTPALFVALHACGSLTPNILRAFLARLKSSDGDQKWSPQAAIVVGCCYNLLEASDFPLSHELTHPTSELPPAYLTNNHLQLAAQAPSQWMRSEVASAATRLAIRKVVWRALLAGILVQVPIPLADNNKQADDDDYCPLHLRRLGKLNDSVYDNWDAFLARAGEKLGVDLMQGHPRDRETESRLEVMHVLRCILGPVVESFILLDRLQWLKEELRGTGMDVELVNLFDQASGSGRNVAIVISPQLHETYVQ